MAYPASFLDEIRNRVPLSEVIGGRVKVTRAGREFKACCPFHHEKTPSFTINDDKQFYHCFGCGAHGDVIKFVMEHDNLSFRDAVESLAAQANLQVPQEDPRAIARAEQAKDHYMLMEEAARWFAMQLQQPSHQTILDYVQMRGLSAETIQRFDVGFAPADGQVFIAYMQAQGFVDKDLIALGLVKPSKRGGKPYAFFRERVVFPVRDRRGRCIAFGGRALPDHLQAPSHDDFTPPKYLNSPDTPLFDKGSILYGEDKARKAARDGHRLLVVEGYMDVVACHQYGFAGAVASMGTALTETQIQQLWAMIPDGLREPVLCFDGDRAGRQAAWRACERIIPLLEPGRSVRFAFMPEGEDPDSLLKSGGQKGLKAILQRSVSLLDYLWAEQAQGRDFDRPEARASFAQDLKKLAEGITHEEVRRHYKSLIDQRISDTFFGHYQNRHKNNKGGRAPANKPKSLLQRPNVPVLNGLHEKILLAALINHPYLFDQVEEQAAALSFLDPGLARLKEQTLLVLSQDPAIDRAALLDYLDKKGLSKEGGDILSEKLYVHAAFAAPVTDSSALDVGEIASKWKDVWQAMEAGRTRGGEVDRWKRAIEEA